jgi:hypothetical protein
MLPHWMIVDRLRRELSALRALERQAEALSAPERPGIAEAQEALAAASRAVDEVAVDFEGQAACRAWHALDRARDQIARASRAVERHQGPRAASLTWNPAPQPG